MSGATSWPTQQCARDYPHEGHTHVNEGPQGGCGLPEWCPGLAASARGGTDGETTEEER